VDIREAFAEFGKDLPTRWVMGDSDLDIDVELLRGGEFDPERRIVKGVVGRGWVTIPCAKAPLWDFAHVRDRLGDRHFIQAVEVVDDVLVPETQISLDAARALKADARAGETIPIAFDADRRELANLLAQGRGIGALLDASSSAGRIAVEFEDLAVDLSDAARGRVIDGLAQYLDELRRPVQIVIAGFTLTLTGLWLDISRTLAQATVTLPPTITDAASCGPATIDLGRIRISRTCDYYFEEPERHYGPWLLGDTGMIIEGDGFTLDLSTTRGPPPLPTSWRGLLLRAGTASGAQRIPDPCNSGYLRGDYTFGGAAITLSGFAGSLDLTAPISFTALNPFGQVFSFTRGDLIVAHSEIVAGNFRGSTDLLPEAVAEGVPHAQITVDLPSVTVQPNYDLTGEIDHGGSRVAWGELTRPGEELVVWTATPTKGFLYLPGGAVETFCPVSTGSFQSPSISAGWSGSLASLAAQAVSGVTFADLGEVAVFSPDVPGGRAAPLVFDRVSGWLRVGTTGADGELVRYYEEIPAKVGDPVATGYVGKKPFRASLFGNDRKNLIAEFVTSAAHDSHVSGWLDIPDPTGFHHLDFEQLKLTSTACLVGGDIMLPAPGIPLEHWDVALVPTNPAAPAGVLSVRTGRLLFTAAGISEPVHFDRPFGLTWGEILAYGSVGDLYLDFNDWGQRFDGLVFHPEGIALSAYVPANLKPYVGVSGSVIFPLFGPHHINVQDAALRPPPPPPTPPIPRPYPRHVTVPKTAITAGLAPTDLALTGVWHDVTSVELARFDFLDAEVDYNEASQEGFIGTGGAVLSFLHSDPLETTVEIHSDATDLRFTSEAAHDLDMSVIARFGALSQIAGNLRIEGPTLRRMTVFGEFEQSAAVGIFGPKAGYSVEANMTVTPTSIDFYAAGDMMLSVALVEIEASATAHLLFDFAAGTAEGELIGRVDCDAVVAGLSGAGQLTWFVGPQMQYLQGRMKVDVFSIVGGVGMEGGFFIGNNVPNALAWALDTTDPKFAMSRAIMPPTITGIYGYGRASFAVNYYVVGGGIDIFVGVGAFSAAVSAGGPLSALGGTLPLPFIVGACGINVHGEILGGLVSASAWANLSLRGPLPPYFEGTFGLEGCVAWVLCASVDVTARVSSAGFELI
jgi:hypothetical protein